MVSLTLNDLTTTEVKSIMFIIDALRSGKEVEVRVGNPTCEDGSCSVPHTSEPVAIDTPYKANDEAVEAVYEVDEKPKKKRGKKPAKPSKKKQSTFTEIAETAGVTEGEPATGTAEVFPTSEPANGSEVVPPAPVVAVPAVTKVDVDNAMAAVFKKNGMTGAKALLLEFRAERSRDLKPEQYPAFIARANEIVNR